MMALIFEIFLVIRLYSEKHQISHLKGPFRSVLISLFLHAILSNGKNILESFQCLVLILKKNLHFPNLGSAQKTGSEGRGFFPMDSFIGIYFSGFMICCVVSPFTQRKPLDPLVFLLQGKGTQICFQEFINYLSFTICLRMIGSTHF